MSDRRFQSFEAFWPYYLSEHDNPRTRLLHVAGTGIALGLMVVVLLARAWLALILVPVVGYGFAWLSHMLVERNRPATFTYPVWSLLGDLRMFWLAIQGKLEAEVARHKGPA